MFSRDDGQIRQADAHGAPFVWAEIWRDGKHLEYARLFRQPPPLRAPWRLVIPMKTLPLPVGARLHLEGYHHGSTYDNGGWDSLWLLMTAVEGERSGQRFVIHSSATWGSPPGCEVADLLPPHLAVESA